ncbi:MAG: hypothetical protein FWE13_02945 [Firmicutes bacterium]|nr:hypothetical protein [Bacillota bacterium]
MTTENIKKILVDEIKNISVPNMWGNIKIANLQPIEQSFLDITNENQMATKKRTHKKLGVILGTLVPVATGLVIFFTLVLPALLPITVLPPTYHPDPRAEEARRAQAQLNQQVKKAIEIQENIYTASELNGGFIVSTNPSAFSSLSYYQQENEQYSTNDTVEFNIKDFATEIFTSRGTVIRPITLNHINPYIIDIFMFSQVKLSLLESFGSEALEKIFDLEFDRCPEFMSIFRRGGGGAWQHFIPYYASFSGFDEETGKSYMTAVGREAGGQAYFSGIFYLTYFTIGFSFNKHNDFSISISYRRYNDDGILLHKGVDIFDAFTQSLVRVQYNATLPNATRVFVVRDTVFLREGLTDSEREVLINFVFNHHRDTEEKIEALIAENLRLAQIVRDFEEYQEQQKTNENYYNEQNNASSYADNSDIPLTKARHPYPHLVEMDFNKLRILRGVS